MYSGNSEKPVWHILWTGGFYQCIAENISNHLNLQTLRKTDKMISYAGSQIVVWVSCLLRQTYATLWISFGTFISGISGLVF